tara:strand:- start:194 stop:613 length:420 start_codon:yes stop_codon:yes gene_type:complete
MALKEITAKDVKKSRAFKDIGIGFKRNSFTNDVATVQNDNSIKQAVKNLLLTAPGEKPFQSDVGSKVKELLFEPLDVFSCDILREEIINTINQYEPRVQLQNVDVNPIYEGNKVNIFVEYRIVGLPVVENIEFVLQRPE